MSLAFWSEVCAESMKRSLSKQLELLHACSGVTVSRITFSRPFCAKTSTLTQTLKACIQIAAFCCCALASCFFFVQWARMDDSARRQLWNLHGAFTALMCFGSCAGSFTWVAKMQQLAYFYVSVDAGNKGSDKDRLFFAQQSSLSSQWAAAFHVGYALDFLCLSLAKLMVLDRMQHFAVSKSHDVQVRWSRARQMVIGAVVTCNLVGLGGNTASSVFFVQAARLFNDAASAFEASRSSDGLDLIDRATRKQQQAEATESVQLFCEVVALIIIIAAFFAVGLLCVRLFKYALDLLHNAGCETELIGTATAQSHKLAQNATAEGKRLRRQIVSTIAVVFVTFLLRAVFSFMNAFADGFQNVSAACPACDGACHNVYTLIKYALPRCSSW